MAPKRYTLKRHTLQENGGRLRIVHRQPDGAARLPEPTTAEAPAQHRRLLLKKAENKTLGSRILSWLFKAMAVVILLAFASVYIFNSLLSSMDYPLYDLLADSQEIKNQTSTEVREAVVYIAATNAYQENFIIEQSTGTGFNIAPEGRIVTNCHVVEDARSIMVTFPDGRHYRAAGWETAPEYDLAVITLAEAAELPSLSLAPDYIPQPGEQFKTIGNPLNYKNLAVTGSFIDYISIIDITDPVYIFAMPIYSGNSGSPVLNSAEQVIGVVSGTVTLNYDNEDSTLATVIPIADILPLLSKVQ